MSNIREAGRFSLVGKPLPEGERPIDPCFEARVHAEIERRMAAIPAMLHCINQAGVLVWVSDAWLEKLGYTREEALGRPSTDFMTEESRTRARTQVLPEFFRTGACENIHYQLVKKDGDIIDVLTSATLAEDASGAGRGALAVLTDITARLEAERLLSESEARYRSLVEDQSEMVSLASPEGELRYVNHAYASLYGARPEAMIGKNLLHFVPADERPALAQHLKRICASRFKVESENQIMLPGGERRWIAWTNRALTDADGRVTVIHSVGRDIQERVDAQHQVRESEARYRFLAENSNDLILLVDSRGDRLYASPACRKMLGYEPDETIAMRLQDAIHPDDAASVLPVLAARPNDTMLTYRMLRKDGSYVWVETTGKTVQIANGERQRLIIVRDIGQRMEAEQRLKTSEARYRLLANHSTDVVFQLDRDLACQYVSPASFEVIGYQPDEMLGMSPVTSSHPDDVPRILLGAKSLMRGTVDRLTMVARMRHRDGRWIWTESQLRVLRDAETNAPLGVIGALRDITERKIIEDELADANRRLQALAGQDALTGLANRRTFDETLSKEFRRARRDEGALALIMLDVDHFKAFNDLYGHPAGDRCLRSIADAIAHAVGRAADVAARYGGEEFAVVLPATDEEGALAIAVRIRQAVAALDIEHSRNPHRFVTISAGVAVIRPGVTAESHEHLLREADRALYLAKNGGRNTVMLAPSPEGARGPAAA